MKQQRLLNDESADALRERAKKTAERLRGIMRRPSVSAPAVADEAPEPVHETETPEVQREAVSDPDILDFVSGLLD